MTLLVTGLVFAALLWAFVLLSLWLNPPLRSGGGQETFSATFVPSPPGRLPRAHHHYWFFLRHRIRQLSCESCRWQINKVACTHEPPRRTPIDLIPDLYVTTVLEGMLLRGIVG